QLDQLGLDRLGEDGLGSEKNLETLRELVARAKSKGWVVPLHFGGASVPGSSVVDAEYAFEIQPTVVSHINGGPTARPRSEVLSLVEDSPFNIEIVFAGNLSIAQMVVNELINRSELQRLQFGTDTPSGTGVVPIGILRLLTELSSATNATPAQLICCATGETLSNYHRQDEGVIQRGARADLVVLGAPMGGESESVKESMISGNVPSVAMTMVGGTIERTASKVTPPPEKKVVLS